MFEFSYLNQSLQLFPERVLYWVESQTLVVADVHLGKAATFRAHGIPVPAGGTQDNLSRLTAVLTKTKAERLLILGDLLHAKAGRTEALFALVDSWRREFQTLAIDLVLGNHDQHAGLPPASWRMRSVAELVEPPFVWRHYPEPSDTGYVVAGHLHPAVHLRDAGEHLMLPCFYFGETNGALPAFGDFTGFSLIRPRAGEYIFVLAEDEIIPFDV